MKDIIAEHFDRSPVEMGTFTMYYQGEWWAPKHKDSLDFLVEHVKNQYTASDAHRLAKRQKLEELSCKIDEAINDIESANTEMWHIIDAEL